MAIGDLEGGLKGRPTAVVAVNIFGFLLREGDSEVLAVRENNDGRYCEEECIYIVSLRLLARSSGSKAAYDINQASNDLMM